VVEEEKRNSKTYVLVGRRLSQRGTPDRHVLHIRRSASMHLRLAFQIFTIRFTDFSVSFCFKEK